MATFISERNFPDLRRQAVELAALGAGRTQISRELGIAPSTVWRWVSRHRSEGEASFQRPSVGRRARLSEQDIERIVHKLVLGPEANGYDTPLWTLARIADLIYKSTGVSFATNYVAELMHGLGWSCQKPERRAKERDEEAIAGWVQTTWPEIKRGRTI